jgi:flagellar protein FlaI
MECMHNINSIGNRKVVYFDCLECKNKGSLRDGNCLRSVFTVLRDKGNVEELQFRGREYTEFYDGGQVERLLEITALGRGLLGDEPWTKVKGSKKIHRNWRIFIKNLLMREVWRDPIKAYKMLIAVMDQYKKPSIGRRFDQECLSDYLRILNRMRVKFESTKLVGDHINGSGIYETFMPRIQPSFLTSQVRLNIADGSRLLSSYKVVDTEIGIYDLNGVDKIYFINPPELYLSTGDVKLLMELKDRVVRGHILEIINPMEARKHFKRIGSDLLKGIADKKPSALESENIAEIFARYTAGYGLLEILFSDGHIHDIYIDSPAGTTPVYVDHDEFGICTTNLYLSEDDLERISSKFRSIGGRPFDEANPIMDMELKEIGIRVTGIREPSTFDGIAYSFRKHREKPWTLPKFVDEGMMSARAAALLGLIVSGQRSVLITGARGSGKTSLLSALITEIKQSDRIVLMEDTPEIPTTSLRELGWKIEHLRNRPVISRNDGDSYELSPEENLRAALRLGESVLVLGEVRGEEARALFEAMRVGAAGNAVLGTIHGSSPYDTWDRVTHDLNVPSTSFKAVDVVISLGYREEREISMRNRYLRNITEVRKEWEGNPQMENGFVDMMLYDDSSGNEVYNLDNSEVLREIAVRKRMSVKECNANLNLRANMIKTQVKASRDGKIKELLEINHVINANREYLRLMNEQTLNCGVDYKKLYRDWREWFSAYVRKSSPTYLSCI